MGALRQAWDVIGKSLGTLTLAHKLLIAALATVAVMALLVVALTTSKASMVELLPGVPADQQAKALTFLKTMSIAYRTEGGKLLVPPDQRDGVIAALSENGSLPADTSVLFNNLAASQHWMNTKSQNDQIANLAVQNELARVVGKFKGVKAATVVVDAPEPIGMGMAYRKPTASVVVFMEAVRGMDRNTVDAIAALVSGAKAGLKITDVKVIDGTTGRQYTARPPEDFGGDYMEQVAKIEERVQEKLLHTLAYIPGVIVAVNAHVDNTRRQVRETKMLPTGGGSVAVVSEEESNVRTDSAAAPSNEPGLRPNIGMSVDGGSSVAGTKTSDEKSNTKFKVGLGSREETVIDPRGMPTRISAVVSVSREYIAALVKQNKGGAGAAPPAGGAAADGEATQAEIDAKFKEEKARLEADLSSLVATVAGDAAGQPAGADGAGPRNVVVSMIPVPTLMSTVVPNSNTAGLFGGGNGGGLMGTVGALATGGLLKQVLLGGMALAAMAMMLMLVRKAARPVELPSADSIVGLPPALNSQNDLVGEADETQTAMEGIELDDQELKTKKMLEQVGEMVQKNPADAAVLVNRWLSTES